MCPFRMTQRAPCALFLNAPLPLFQAAGNPRDQGLEPVWTVRDQGLEPVWTVRDRGLEPVWIVRDQGLEPVWTVRDQGLEPVWTVRDQGLEPVWIVRDQVIRSHAPINVFLQVMCVCGGGGGGGAGMGGGVEGLPQGIKQFQKNWGLIPFPCDTILCQKSPRWALKFRSNFF